MSVENVYGKHLKRKRRGTDATESGKDSKHDKKGRWSSYIQSQAEASPFLYFLTQASQSDISKAHQDALSFLPSGNISFGGPGKHGLHSDNGDDVEGKKLQNAVILATHPEAVPSFGSVSRIRNGVISAEKYETIVGMPQKPIPKSVFGLNTVTESGPIAKMQDATTVKFFHEKSSHEESFQKGWRNPEWLSFTKLESADKVENDAASESSREETSDSNIKRENPFQRLFKPQSYEEESTQEFSDQGWTKPLHMLPTKALSLLDYSQYTVAWICALPKEMTAAKAMLDERHAPLPNPPGDHNAYELGSIGIHNIVITCLRQGIYGTTSATAVVTALRSTYFNSTILPLLVGVGGGVPYPDTHDIRLGDVVISSPTPEYPAVSQYDYGKNTGDHDLQARGTLNKPADAWLNVLSNFQSDLILGRNHVAAHILTALEKYDLAAHGFSYPGSQLDVLYDGEIAQADGTLLPKIYTPRLIHRAPREHNDPVVHFGGIASGNAVIKHAQTRDRIATRFGALSFEMEAAGIMDYVPCLVIRGICDYCDSHKQKDFQGYAALAAAAVAKELLLLATTGGILKRSDQALRNTTLANRRKLVDCLNFADMYSAYNTIKRAHRRTCGWILEQTQVISWAEPDDFRDHHGLLWVKGKPGTGKSTIIKYMLDYTKSIYEENTTVVISSFFFNARASRLHRSTIGLYRALLAQILRQIPVLEVLLDNQQATDIVSESFEWSLDVLETLMRDVVRRLGSIHLICYIDALDECPENEVRQMVDFFHDLTEDADANHLHVCFSSRHYPNISLRTGCVFILESQIGHSDDVLAYLDTELVLDKNKLAKKLRRKVYEKSGQIFLWVILVVQLLKREYDHGGIHKLMKLLDETPSEINDLFRGILTRDGFKLTQLITIIQWVLYAQRPLTSRELYHIVLCVESSFVTDTWGELEPTHDDMRRYLLSCSKGLIEMTTAIEPVVQFIHETVREFLLRPGSLQGLWSNFEGLSAGSCHEALRDHCYQYILQIAASHAAKAESTLASEAASSIYVFREYAIEHLFYHANQAARLHIPQTEFLVRLESNPSLLRLLAYYDPRMSLSVSEEDLPALRGLYHSSIEANSSAEGTASTKLANSSNGILLLNNMEQLGCFFTLTNCSDLLQQWLSVITTTSAWEDTVYHIIALFVCTQSVESFERLVSNFHIFRGTSGPSNVNALVWFSMLRELLNKGSEQSTNEMKALVSLLLTDCKASEAGLVSGLCIAAGLGNGTAIKYFLSCGADINGHGMDGSTALHRAVFGLSNTDDAAELDPFLCTYRRTALEAMPTLAYSTIDEAMSILANSTIDEELPRVVRTISCIQLLKNHGADLTRTDAQGRTPLTLAIEREVLGPKITLQGYVPVAIREELDTSCGWNPILFGEDMRRTRRRS